MSTALSVAQCELVVARFAQSLQGAVDSVERCAGARGGGGGGGVSAAEQVSALAQRVEDVEEAVAFCERLRERQAGPSLPALVALARDKERAQRALLAALGAEPPVEAPLHEERAAEVQARAVRARAQARAQAQAQACSPSPADSGSPANSPTRGAPSRPTAASSHAASPSSLSDLGSTRSDPPTPTLEDFGLHGAKQDDDEEEENERDAAGRGDECEEDEDYEDEQEPSPLPSREEPGETIELAYLTEQDLQTLPVYLQAQVELHWLNDAYRQVAAAACQSARLELGLAAAEAAIGDRRRCKAALLALLQLGKLRSAGAERYRLVSA
jgi:hypothetical protein